MQRKNIQKNWVKTTLTLYFQTKFNRTPLSKILLPDIDGEFRAGRMAQDLLVLMLQAALDRRSASFSPVHVSDSSVFVEKLQLNLVSKKKKVLQQKEFKQKAIFYSFFDTILGFWVGVGPPDQKGSENACHSQVWFSTSRPTLGADC